MQKEEVRQPQPKREQHGHFWCSKCYSFFSIHKKHLDIIASGGGLYCDKGHKVYK